MNKLTKLKTLQKNVVDTAANYAAWDATCAAWDTDYDSAAADAADLASDNAGRAYDSLYQAKRELAKYLKEQQGND